MKQGFRIAMMGLAASALALTPAAHAQYRNKIAHNPASCNAGGPAVKVTVTGVKESRGTMRVQTYKATKSDWLETGKWLHRVEAPARKGTMTFCLPVPASGSYGVAVRHDLNGNGKTDLREDGGGMSGNPSINIFNLGKPSYKKVAFSAGAGITPVSIEMKYW